MAWSQGLLTQQHMQESLSTVYLRAVASHAGMSCAVPNPDYGIDFTIRENTWRTDTDGRRQLFDSGFGVDVQLKSTTVAIVEEGTVSYDMDVRAYDTLRPDKTLLPRILVLHVQPTSDRCPLVQTEESLALVGCCYWVCLQGSQPVPNRSSVRIQVPRRNIFSADALRTILERTKRRAPRWTELLD